MKQSITCFNPQQAHQALMLTIWPALNAATMAGHRMIVELKPETRSLAQNARLWAMLTDISRQVVWHGRKLSPDDWKHIFSASLKKQDVAPGLDGGFVVLGLSTSNMTKTEMGDMQTLMEEFGAQQGVIFRDQIDTDTGEILA